jgi:hypothetical protein
MTATFLRRDDHATMPVIYKLALKGVKCDTWRTSEREWFRMVQAKETAK